MSLDSKLNYVNSDNIRVETGLGVRHGNILSRAHTSCDISKYDSLPSKHCSGCSGFVGWRFNASSQVKLEIHGVQTNHLGESIESVESWDRWWWSYADFMSRESHPMCLLCLSKCKTWGVNSTVILYTLVKEYPKKEFSISLDNFRDKISHDLMLG